MKKGTTFRLPLDKNESSRLYWELSKRGAFCSGVKHPWGYRRISEEEFLTLGLLQSRYDPRLLAVLIDFFCSPRSSLNPVRFKEVLRKEGALPITAVVGEFVLRLSASSEVKELFRYLMTNVSPVATQLFYRGLYPLGGAKIEEVLERPLRPFKRWGFLAADPPLIKDQQRQTSRRHRLFDRSSRLRIVQEYAKRTKTFRLRECLREIGFSVSRQQALKDLKALHSLKKRGRGKGTFYTFSP